MLMNIIRALTFKNLQCRQRCKCKEFVDYNVEFKEQIFDVSQKIRGKGTWPPKHLLQIPRKKIYDLTIPSNFILMLYCMQVHVL